MQKKKIFYLDHKQHLLPQINYFLFFFIHYIHKIAIISLFRDTRLIKALIAKRKIHESINYVEELNKFYSQLRDVQV